MAEDKEKAIECAEKIGKNFKAWAEEYMKKTGKKEFTLAELVPDWEQMETGLRWVTGIEFADRIVPNSPDIVHTGKSDNGDDLYALK